MKKAIVSTMLLSGLLVGSAAAPLAQAGAQGRPKMEDAPVQQVRPFAKFSSSAQSLRDSIVALTQRQVGIKYKRGAQSPEFGFDCSGLVRYVMEHFNISVPRTSREQAKVGTALARKVDVLKPGDLLTFGKGKRISHVGIYIGDGKYVHANTPGGQVKVATLKGGTWWKGARRLVSTDSTFDKM